ncbi:MAG: hypothetical protein FWE62_05730 [Firmicutes bacterium]|nr:hypothetical protein [Bacillota bacterium]
MFFDISWRDDALYQNNKAAVVVVTSAYIALTLIYAGANAGDGPGWWCVIFAGGLGLITWLILSWVFNAVAKVFERITVGRDTACAIRFSLYLVAAGIILGKACSGDWTSFGRTVVEFADGWPVLPLTAAAILIELFFKYREKTAEVYQGYAERTDKTGIAISAFFGLLYVAAAIACVVLMPAFIAGLQGGAAATNEFPGGVL